MRRAVTFLAERRWAGVGLALTVELGILAALALAPAATVVGVPAAIAAAIAGTVAVVFGVLDGVAVALLGALVFAAGSGWDAGELAALALWPAIVAAVGIFARRIERRRVALGTVVLAQESDRRRLALELHDEVAQALAGALMTLRAAGGAADPAAAAAAREMIGDAIASLRVLAVELSPKALEDYGLAPALERLAAAHTGLEVHVTSGWQGRAAREIELAVFRFVEDALAAAAADGARAADVAVDERDGTVVARVEQHGGRGGAALREARDAQRERLRLLGGRLAVSTTPDGTTLRAELPARAR